MNTQEEMTTQGIWPITELEMAARDLLDIGVWEAAEEEEDFGAETPLSATTPIAPVQIDTPLD